MIEKAKRKIVQFQVAPVDPWGVASIYILYSNGELWVYGHIEVPIINNAAKVGWRRLIVPK